MITVCVTKSVDSLIYKRKMNKIKFRQSMKSGNLKSRLRSSEETNKTETGTLLAGNNTGKMSLISLT
jgi:hypothetical protein